MSSCPTVTGKGQMLWLTNVKGRGDEANGTCQGTHWYFRFRHEPKTN